MVHIVEKLGQGFCKSEIRLQLYFEQLYRIDEVLIREWESTDKARMIIRERFSHSAAFGTGASTD